MHPKYKTEIMIKTKINNWEQEHHRPSISKNGEYGPSNHIIHLNVFVGPDIFEKYDPCARKVLKSHILQKHKSCRWQKKNK